MAELNIRSETIELILSNLFGGVKAVHNKTYLPWINNKRINKYKNYTLQKENGELNYFENGKPTIWNNLDSEEQLELIKYRNMNNNGQKLNEKLENIVNNSSEESIQNRIMENINKNEDALLYFTERFKYLSDEKKMNIISEMISRKLEQDEEMSILLFDFINGLTREDIEKLQKIKQLLLMCSIIKLDEDDEIACMQYIDGHGNSIEKVCEASVEFYFPYITGDNILKDLDVSINWSDIQNYAIRGLYSSTMMQRYLDSSDDNKMIYIFTYNNKRHLLESFKKSVRGNIFLLSNLGVEVFKYIPDKEENLENYIDFINEKNLFPDELIDITELGKCEEIRDKVLKKVIS